MHPDFPWAEAHVIHAVRHQFANRVEDVLSRRLRALPLNAQASKNRHGPARRQIRAVGELDRDAAWQTKQVAAFGELAAGYLP